MLSNCSDFRKKLILRKYVKSLYCQNKRHILTENSRVVVSTGYIWIYLAYNLKGCRRPLAAGRGWGGGGVIFGVGHCS